MAIGYTLAYLYMQGTYIIAWLYFYTLSSSRRFTVLNYWRPSKKFTSKSALRHTNQFYKWFLEYHNIFVRFTKIYLKCNFIRLVFKKVVYFFLEIRAMDPLHKSLEVTSTIYIKRWAFIFLGVHCTTLHMHVALHKQVSRAFKAHLQDAENWSRIPVDLKILSSLLWWLEA